MTLKEQVMAVVAEAPEPLLQEFLEWLQEKKSSFMQLNPVEKEWSEELSRFYGSIQDETFVRQPQPVMEVRESL